MLYGSPNEGLTERGASLMTRSANWLARYRQILPDQSEDHYKQVTMLAAATFEENTMEGEPSIGKEALTFVSDNWTSIDQVAMMMETGKDIEDL